MGHVPGLKNSRDLSHHSVGELAGEDIQSHGNSADQDIAVMNPLGLEFYGHLSCPLGSGSESLCKAIAGM